MPNVRAYAVKLAAGIGAVILAIAAALFVYLTDKADKKKELEASIAALEANWQKDPTTALTTCRDLRAKLAADAKNLVYVRAAAVEGFCCLANAEPTRDYKLLTDALQHLTVAKQARESRAASTKNPLSERRALIAIHEAIGDANRTLAEIGYDENADAALDAYRTARDLRTRIREPVPVALYLKTAHAALLARHPKDAEAAIQYVEKAPETTRTEAARAYELRGRLVLDSANGRVEAYDEAARCYVNARDAYNTPGTERARAEAGAAVARALFLHASHADAAAKSWESFQEADDALAGIDAKKVPYTYGIVQLARASAHAYYAEFAEDWLQHLQTAATAAHEAMQVITADQPRLYLRAVYQDAIYQATLADREEGQTPEAKASRLRKASNAHRAFRQALDRATRDFTATARAQMVDAALAGAFAATLAARDDPDRAAWLRNAEELVKKARDLDAQTTRPALLAVVEGDLLMARAGDTQAELLAQAIDKLQEAVQVEAQGPFFNINHVNARIKLANARRALAAISPASTRRALLLAAREDLDGAIARAEQYQYVFLRQEAQRARNAVRKMQNAPASTIEIRRADGSKPTVLQWKKD